MEPANGKQQPERETVEEAPEEDASSGAADEQEKSTSRELLELLARLRKRFEPLGKDLVQWLQAEARLREFEIRERFRLTVTRIVLIALAVIPALTAWIFLNVTLWRASGELTGMGWVPPLTVTVLNGLVALILLSRVDRMQL